MPRLFLLILLLSIAGSSCHDRSTDQPDQSAYYLQVRSFIHWYRENHQLDSTSVLEDSAASYKTADIIYSIEDTANVTPSDRLELWPLAKKLPILRWTTDLTGPIQFIRSDSSGDHRYNRFSCPIFFRNYTRCLFYADHHCGPHCGGGGLTLYKKEGDHWVRIQTYGGWAM